MIASLLPPSTLKQVPEETVKSTATVSSVHPPQTQNKLPPNAKIIGNYLLGTTFINQAKILDKELSEKFTWLCIFQVARKWQSK